MMLLLLLLLLMMMASDAGCSQPCAACSLLCALVHAAAVRFTPNV